jgi:SMP-30/Gluconolactonase/LRE-like region
MIHHLMRRTGPLSALVASAIVLLIVFGTVRAGAADQSADVPKGEVTKRVFDRSRIFPGTVRDYWIYVPRQYNPEKPACLYVNQDGIQYDAPAVFDELIHKKEMPVTIGVFVMHGKVKALSPRALDRFNQVQPDGSLAHKQRYYHLHVPDDADDAGADGMRVDRDGRLYVATRMGIHVCDQAGRVNCIIPTPNGKISNLCFGGAQFDVLYATCGDKVYKRKVKVKGANAFQEPIKPAAPKL